MSIFTKRSIHHNDDTPWEKRPVFFSRSLSMKTLLVQPGQPSWKAIETLQRILGGTTPTLAGSRAGLGNASMNR